jgi:hypothetical protein
MATHLGETRDPDREAFERAVYVEPEGGGWIAFAMTLLALAGSLNVIQGIVGLTTSKFYVADAKFVFSDLRTWAWIVLVLGIVQILAAVGLSRRNQAARWFAIAVAGLNAIGQLLFVQSYPFWSLTVFALDILVIYGLAVYGGRDTLAD